MPPVFPSKTTLRFPTRSCPWSPGSTDPAVWTASAPTALAGVQIGEETYSDTALALFSGGNSPSNAADLQALTDRFASDTLAWRQTQFDESFAGVAAIQPTGLAEYIEWDLTSKRHATRVYTSPGNRGTRQLAHQIYDPDGNCPDPGPPGSVATHTPYSYRYGPPVVPGNTNSSYSLNLYKVSLEDGRLRQQYVRQDAFTCGCGQTICVAVCGSIPVVGALVQLYTGTTLVDSCTTGTNGCCALNDVGAFTVKVTVSGQVVYQAGRTLTGTGTLTIAISSESSYVCCGGYAIPQTLTLTDAAGSLSFVYYPNSSDPTWYGGHAVNLSSCTVTTPNNVCVAANPTIGPVRVCYQMICYAGTNPTFALQRSWSWVYEPGTLTPIWYQDPSGFVAGQPCTTGPPAMCGSPHTDISSDSENPTNTNPFTISFAPVPAVSNYTSDPVGGTVAIS